MANSNIYIFLAIFAAIFASGLGQDRRFCPSATPNNPRCQANATQYKCGVFFENLPGKGALTWLGGLPDVFRKKVSTGLTISSGTLYSY